MDTCACDKMPLGRTPLSWAVWSGHAGIVEMLLEAHVRQLEERVVPGTVVAGMPIA